MKASYKISLVVAAGLLLLVIIYYASQRGGADTPSPTDTGADARLANSTTEDSPRTPPHNTSRDRADPTRSSLSDRSGAGSNPSNNSPGFGGGAGSHSGASSGANSMANPEGRSTAGGEGTSGGGSDMMARLQARLNRADAAAGNPNTDSPSSPGSPGTMAPPPSTNDAADTMPPPPDSADATDGQTMFPGIAKRDTSTPGNSPNTPENPGSATPADEPGNSSTDTDTGPVARGNRSPSTSAPSEADSNADNTGNPDSANNTQPQTYTIKAGDSFASIAQARFGSQVHWQDIAQANPLVDPKKLQVGQEIRLPPRSKVTGASSPAGGSAGRSSESGDTPGDGRIRYTVQPSDTLSDIARQYYANPTQWRRIYNANRQAIGDNPAGLKAGQTIIIPPPADAP